MLGHIYLVKNEKSKVIPAVVLSLNNNQLIMAQIRKTNIEEIYSDEKKKTKFYERIKEKSKQSSKSKTVHTTINIGRSEGLLFPSTVMLNRVFIITQKDIIKQISRLDSLQLKACIDQYDNIQSHRNLHKKMKQVKHKIQLAQLNNDRYDHYEKELEMILNQIGYPEVKREKIERGYLNYREVPTKGYIKIYKGGR